MHRIAKGVEPGRNDSQHREDKPGDTLRRCYASAVPLQEVSSGLSVLIHMIINTDDRLVKDMARMGVAAYGVLHALSLYMNGEKTCYPSRESLMKLTGLSRDKLLAAIKTLIELGYLEAQQENAGKFGKVTYRIKAPISIYITPCTENPDTGNAHTENPPIELLSNNKLLIPPTADTKKLSMKRLATLIDEKRRLLAGAPGVVWNEKEISNLKRLMEALRKMKPVEDFDEETQVKYLSRFIDIAHADEWMQDKLTPSMLYSQFNNIMTKHYSKKAEPKQQNLPYYKKLLP